MTVNSMNAGLYRLILYWRDFPVADPLLNVTAAPVICNAISGPGVGRGRGARVAPAMDPDDLRKMMAPMLNIAERTKTAI
jgi:hypothetical protein